MVPEEYQQLGLTDVHAQTLDLAPKWFPQSWEVTVTAGGKTIPLVSARPGYRGPVTPPAGLDLDVVNVGAGSEADFAGRDVRGKAALIFSVFGLGPAKGALQRAEAKGAAAIFNVNGIPGNLQLQYASGNKVPNFSLGNDDGIQLRDLIGEMPGGKAPRVRIKLDAKEIPNLKSANVWGTLPGATDETIYILAHRDGWFDASIDNGSGIAVQIGLAEDFAKIRRPSAAAPSCFSPPTVIMRRVSAPRRIPPVKAAREKAGRCCVSMERKAGRSSRRRRSS